MNKGNSKFYNSFPLGMLNNHFAESAGLKCAFELNHKTIEKLIYSSNSIIELGAGEGRIIDGLIKKDYLGRIYAVERSKIFLNYLKKKYASMKNIFILKGDLLKDDLPKTDLGIFFWGGILEFSKEEQKQLIKRLSNYCKVLVIDSPQISSKTNATKRNRNNLTLRTNFGEIGGRIPLPSEIKKWSKPFYKKFEKIDYKTENKRERIFYILSV